MVDIAGTVVSLHKSFKTGITRPYEWRVKQIKAIVKMVKAHEKELEAAMALDLKKPSIEFQVGEISNIGLAAKEVLSSLWSWMQIETVPCFGFLAPAACESRKEPYGVVLIIGPYNYPVQLTLKPLIGAIAGGNCAVIKPSELNPATSALLSRLISQYLDSSCVKVVEGGVAETQTLLAQPLDFIAFTGSHRVGKIIAKAAAEQMIPCLLELGGKNAAIVDERVESIEVAARRIAWGVGFNAGQSCLKPDYVVVLEKHAAKLKQLLVHCMLEFYGPDPAQSPDMGRQVSANACVRIQKLLGQDAGDVLCGGEVQPDERYVAPTVLSETPRSAPIMREELFAPVISVITVKDIDEAISVVNEVSKQPLVLMVFSSSNAVIEKCMQACPSGCVINNDTLCNNVQPNIPFGGYGASGLGTYHGRFSFETFTRKMGVIHKQLNYNTAITDPFIRYPPFASDPFKARLFRCAADYLPMIPPVSVWGILKRTVQLAAFASLAHYILTAIKPR